MSQALPKHIRTITTDLPIWDRFFTIAPLVLIGTKENEEYDFAPKHMVTPMGWQNYFAFVCAPRHRTYQNIVEQKQFTVSYPRPTQLVATSLAAAPRCGDDSKPSLLALPSFRATKVDGVFVTDAYIFFECQLVRIVDGFGENSLIVGEIIAAHVHDDCIRASDRDDQELIHHAPQFVYVHPNRMASVADTFSFPFPEGFKR